MDGLITQGAKERIAEERHRTEVLLVVAQELSQRYVEALTEVVKTEGLISDATYSRLLRAFDRAYAQYRAQLGPHAFAAKSAALKFKRGYFTPKPPFTREQKEKLYRAMVGEELPEEEPKREAALPAPAPIPVPAPPSPPAPQKKKPTQPPLGDSPSQPSVAP